MRVSTAADGSLELDDHRHRCGLPASQARVRAAAPPRPGPDPRPARRQGVDDDHLAGPPPARVRGDERERRAKGKIYVVPVPAKGTVQSPPPTPTAGTGSQPPVTPEPGSPEPTPACDPGRPARDRERRDRGRGGRLLPRRPVPGVLRRTDRSLDRSGPVPVVGRDGRGGCDHQRSRDVLLGLAREPDPGKPPRAAGGARAPRQPQGLGGAGRQHGQRPATGSASSCGSSSIRRH